ncbi:multiheme c-type cytochrome [Ferrimonas pelagia]|uniref:Decaheme c-type cytochrome MtrC n=1 Tax=Ferrimonas pelagia TaxID=1177826 RepID=A0ABP9EIF1_9GAMM
MTNQKQLWRLGAIAAVVATGLTGCNDGNDGSDGTDGRPGGAPAEVINTLNLDVTNVQNNGDTTTVTVLATNENDESVVGLEGFTARRTQLLPAGERGVGDRAGWQSLNKSGAEISDLANGYYEIEFTNGDTVNNSLTQKVGLIVTPGTLIDGTTEVPYTEAFATFAADGSAARFDNNTVAGDACIACHSDSETIYHGHGHGNDRGADFQTCVMCHDDEETQRRDLTLIVHDKHILSGFDGIAGTPGSELGNNCSTCHVDAVGYGEWGNWMNVPTIESCTICHNDGHVVDGSRRFPIPTKHMQQLGDNSQCAACHTAEGTGVVIGTYDAHMGGFDSVSQLINDITFTAESSINDDNSVTVTVEFFNKNDAISIVDIADNIDMAEFVSNIGPNFPVLGYSGKDSGVLHAEDIAGAIVDGQLSYTTKALPFGEGDAATAFTMIGMRVCGENGALVACSDSAEKVALNAFTSFVATENNTVAQRHSTLDNANCLACHTDTFQLHNGSHHTGFVLNENVQVGDCASCHTPEGTYAPTNMGAIELKLHKVHGEQKIVADCAQCHTDFDLASFENKAGINTGADAFGEALYSTPRAATCISCHSDLDKDIGGITLKNHMEEWSGAAVNTDREVADDKAQSESCFYCHKPTLEDHTVTFQF